MGAWKDFEREDGDEKSQAQVGELMPRRVKKRRKIETEDGSDQGWEEYFDYIFPEDEAEEENEDVEISAENGEDASTAENIDADDQDIVNESSSSSDDDEGEEKKDVSEKSKADSSDDGAEGDAKKRKLESDE